MRRLQHIYEPREVGSATPVVCPTPLDAVQRAHYEQMDRSAGLHAEMCGLGATTVLPCFGQKGFIGSVVPISGVVDLALTKFNRAITSRPTPATSYRVYKTFWDEEAGEIRIGGGNENPFTKDLSRRPFVGAHGPVFDYEANDLNYQTAMCLDSQLEVGCCREELQREHPAFGRFLLAFRPETPPTFTDTEWLRLDAVDALANTVGHMTWAGVDGTVMGLDNGDDAGILTAMIQTSHGEVVLEFPSIACFLPTLRAGTEVKREDPVVHYRYTPKMEDLADLPELDLQLILGRQWSREYTRQVVFRENQRMTLYAIPYEYISPESRKLSTQRLRDVSSILGRTLYDHLDPDTVVGHTEDEAAISVVRRSAMTGVYRDVTYNLLEVRDIWSSYFTE